MDLAARFRAIIDGFCQAVAARGAARNLAPDTRAPLRLLWTRLRRAAGWFGEPGGGAQYKTDISVGDLVRGRYLQQTR